MSNETDFMFKPVNLLNFLSCFVGNIENGFMNYINTNNDSFPKEYRNTCASLATFLSNLYAKKDPILLRNINHAEMYPAHLNSMEHNYVEYAPSTGIAYDHGICEECGLVIHIYLKPDTDKSEN